MHARRDRATRETRDGSGAVRRDFRVVAVHVMQARQEVRARPVVIDDEHERAVVGAGIQPGYHGALQTACQRQPDVARDLLGQPIGVDE